MLDYACHVYQIFQELGDLLHFKKKEDKMNTRPTIQDSPAPVSLNVTFNQNASCFSASLDSGFAVFESDPCALKVSRDFNSGIGEAEMLGRANYMALVGGGRRPKYPQNKVGMQIKPVLRVTPLLTNPLSRS